MSFQPDRVDDELTISYNQNPDGTYVDSIYSGRGGRGFFKTRRNLTSGVEGYQKRNPKTEAEELTIDNYGYYGEENETPKTKNSMYGSSYYETPKPKPQVKKMTGMTYPKSSGGNPKEKDIKTSDAIQNYLIGMESDFKPTIPVKREKGVIKHYEKLCWYVRGCKIKNPVVHLNITQIAKEYGCTVSMIRDVHAICAKTTLTGYSAHVKCEAYPILNQCPWNYCDSNNNKPARKKYFANIVNGHNDYEAVVKRDIFKLSKKGAMYSLLEYQDDNEMYPFRELMVKYDKLLSEKKKSIRKYYKKYPRSGEDYLKEIIALSKGVPLSLIEEMQRKEYKPKFKKDYGDDVYYLRIMNGGGSTPMDVFTNIATMCPISLGSEKLKYFDPPPPRSKNMITKLSKERVLKLLKLLEMLKKDHGMTTTIPFQLCLHGDGLDRASAIAGEQHCVALQVCIKMSAKRKR
jgi:hypothetical protein